MQVESQVESSTFVPSITWLNWSGDITITWDAKSEAAVCALIEEKMKAGYSFFIVKPRLLWFLGDKQVPLRNPEDLSAAKGLVVPDATAEAFLKAVQDHAVAQAIVAGLFTPAKVPQRGSQSTVRRATTAADVVRNQSVAVRPIVGG